MAREDMNTEDRGGMAQEKRRKAMRLIKKRLDQWERGEISSVSVRQLPNGDVYVDASPHIFSDKAS